LSLMQGERKGESGGVGSFTRVSGRETLGKKGGRNVEWKGQTGAAEGRAESNAGDGHRERRPESGPSSSRGAGITRRKTIQMGGTHSKRPNSK